MNPLLKKLNYKDQQEIFVLNAPGPMASLLKAFDREVPLRTELPEGTPGFTLIFVMRSEEISHFAAQLKNRLTGDPIIWFAYPKRSSGNYDTDISRDYGWGPLGELGLEPVRQVAIDEDWSALRFREVDHIRTMTRRQGMRLSDKGKKRAQGK